MSKHGSPRQTLNNFLQSRGMINDIQWDVTRQGPPHDPVWYAVCQLRGVVLGNGRARKKREAKDEAALMALEALTHPPPRVSVLIRRRRNSFP
ncbi:hypothetical protein BJ322DRAFT_1031677 [Thelephora terrestris]|uniref:DRBM domain-containing protein n=1 Tax=Thelephora terrestris TaxID=56493 RepID=A0A9P6HQN0_9AGAM|nr:hypothetical protein BJ322DRAFT_1031677 [Thelephora terrestris]